jgi:hypothetical protein
MPVFDKHITGFSRNGEENYNTLSWNTVSETNTDYFSVERSCDHLNWEEAFKLKAEVNSAESIPYNWRDDSPYPGVTYYRIKTVFNDGTFSYSQSIVVESKMQIAVEIYPNPANGVVKLTVLGKDNESSHVYIKNMMGVALFSADITNNSVMEVDIEEFPEGIYAVDVESKNGSTVQRLIKR